ncbi:hypothetical protein PBI_JF4_68 [Mycobacterium phage JF4]|uniref:DUF7246 domain-containing protein n=1 Tax=Mycobacterium phage MK4 TaxID=2725639 RepID=A0A6M3T3Y3_9CAUD|nr:hypothetical protein PBI_MK4_70 [Mycobacterium phage MK4]QJD52199.1 hypothetical protein PBI_JF4_68 [Mycobacterium phage JF4]QJD52279.1 hypothetical protein PBI_JF2_68 [Mycobacterium phage JF2]BBC53783.1 hypothetical protein [Mycobacterium phage B1]
MAELITEPVKVNGRALEPGTEVSVKGESGRFRFVKATRTSKGLTVLDFVGGTPGRESFRSFYPERIETVHRIAKTPQNTHPKVKRPKKR